MNKKDAKNLRNHKKEIRDRLNQKETTDLIVKAANELVIESSSAMISAILKKPEARALLVKAAARMTLFQDLIAPLSQDVQDGIMEDIKREITDVITKFSQGV